LVAVTVMGDKVSRAAPLETSLDWAIDQTGKLSTEMAMAIKRHTTGWILSIECILIES
jgi:hypothetical protein